MQKTKIKHRLSTEDINRIIDMFLTDVRGSEDLKQYLGGNSPKTIGLGIIATLDCVNENARWITKSNADHLSESVVGAPLYYNHDTDVKTANGNFFYSKQYTTIDGKHTFLIGAFSTIYAYLNDYTKKSFSVGYNKNKESVCPECKMAGMNFYNVKDKEVVCGSCGKTVEKNIDASQLKVLPHSIVWEKGKTEKGDVMFYPVRSMAKLKQTHAGKVTDNNIYFMYIDKNASVSEVSIVQNPADSLSAPLLAYANTYTLNALLTKNDESGVNVAAKDAEIISDVRKGVVTVCDVNELEELESTVDFSTVQVDTTIEDKDEKNNIKTEEGEYMKKYAYKLLKQAKDLNITLPELADAYFDEKPESETRFLEAFTDDLAVTAVASVWKGLVNNTESLRKTIADFQNEKDAYLTDKEALVKEVADLKAEVEKLKNPGAGSANDSGKQVDPANPNVDPSHTDAAGSTEGQGNPGAGEKGDPHSTDQTLPPSGSKKKNFLK